MKLRYTLGLLLLATTLTAAPAKIGLLLKDRSPFWQAAEKGAQAAAKDAGVELIVKAPPITSALHQQRAMLDAMMKEDLAVLVIAPLSDKAFNEQLTALAAKGTKIVALDTNLSGNIAQVYVGYNQAVMAEDAGRVFAKMIGPNGNGGLLRANAVDTMNVRERTLLAAVKTNQPTAVLHTDIFAGGEKDDDYPKSIMLLEKHPEMKAVCTLFTATTLAMTKAIQAKGIVGKTQHIGFGTGLPDDVVAAIDNGVMQAWVAQQPRLIGVKGVEAAVALIQGKTMAATLDVPYTIVTKENLKSPEVQAIRN